MTPRLAYLLTISSITTLAAYFIADYQRGELQNFFLPLVFGLVMLAIFWIISYGYGRWWYW